MKSWVALALLAVAPAFGSEPPAPAEAKPMATAEAKPAAEDASKFKPPPGFRTKKRGDLTLYCRREAVLGSRFQAEKCYDEEGIRLLRLADLEKTEMLERIRACGSASCSAN